MSQRAMGIASKLLTTHYPSREIEIRGKYYKKRSDGYYVWVSNPNKPGRKCWRKLSKDSVVTDLIDHKLALFEACERLATYKEGGK